MVKLTIPKIVKLRIPTTADYFGSSGMSNQDMFAKIIAFVNMMAKVLGSGIFSDNYTPFNLVFLWMFVNVMGHIIMTFHNFYSFGDDLARVCFLMITFLCPVQGLSMMHVFVFRREKIKELLRRIEEFLKKYNTKKVHVTFEKWILLSCHCCLVIAFGIFLCAILIFVYPIVYFFIFGEKIRHFGFELPWMNWRTTIGYSLNFFHSGVITYLFAFALFITVFLSVLIIVMSFGQFELLAMLFDELNDLIAGNENGENGFKIKKSIVEIADNSNELFA